MDFIEKNKLLLGVLALLGGIVAVVMLMQQQEEDDRPTEDAEVVAALLPDLDKDELTEVEIQRPDEPTVKLVKEGDTWRLVEPLEADADQGIVNTMLTKLDELTALRVAATNTDNHERLQVTDELGIRVIVRADGADQLNMIVGNSSGGNTMVRLDGEDRVIAAQGAIKFAFNKSVTEWRNKQILDETSGDVSAISFSNSNGSWSFSRNEEDDWVGIEGQAEIERFDGAKVQAIVASLARIRAVGFGAADLDEAGAGFGVAVEPAPEAVEGEDAPAPVSPATATLTLGGSDDEPERTVTLRVSHEGPEAGKLYLVREGDSTVFAVSSFSADRIRVDAGSFQAALPGEEEEAPEAPPEMPAMPGGQELPPEIMRQLQQQLGMAGP